MGKTEHLLDKNHGEDNRKNKLGNCINCNVVPRYFNRQSRRGRLGDVVSHSHIGILNRCGFCKFNQKGKIMRRNGKNEIGFDVDTETYLGNRNKKNSFVGFTVIHTNETEEEVMAIISRFGKRPTKEDFDFLLIRGDGNFFVKFKKEIKRKPKKKRCGAFSR